MGKKLSETLGIPCYDKEILEMASELSGINETLFFEANEKINKGQVKIHNAKGAYTGRLYTGLRHLLNLKIPVIRRNAVFFCQIFLFYMLCGVVLYVIMRYEDLV